MRSDKQHLHLEGRTSRPGKTRQGDCPPTTRDGRMQRCLARTGRGCGAPKTEDLTPLMIREPVLVVGSRCFLEFLWGLYELSLETIIPPGRLHTHVPMETGKAQTAGHRRACCTVVVLKTEEEAVMPAGPWKT